MDGYAVRSADTAPGVALRLAGGVAAGEVSDGRARARAPRRAISTGAALPPGADAILQSELADGRRRHGDARAGDRAGPPRALPRRGRARRRRAGARRRAADAAAAVRAGLRGRRRGRRAPPPAAAPARHGLGAAAARRAAGAGPHPRVQRADGLACSPRRAGAEVVDGGVVPDDRAATLEAVERGLAGDVLVVSGGVSVGPHDHVKPAFEACGVEEVLWRVQIKPGKPLWFGPPRLHARVRAARATRCRASSASACSSSRRCGACRASATPRPRLVRGRLAGAGGGRPTGARRSSPRAIAHGRRRRARGDPDRAPGLAHDRRARRERRVRGRAARLPGAAGRGPRWTCCCSADVAALEHARAGARRYARAAARCRARGGR